MIDEDGASATSSGAGSGSRTSMRWWSRIRPPAGWDPRRRCGNRRAGPERTADLLSIRPEDAAPRDRLGHVYWIGGGSGAGKSTIARRLAARHGLRLYATDEVMRDHARRSTIADSPLLAGFAAMDMDERWVSRSPEAMLETFGWFRGEGFGLIVEDLLRLPDQPGVIAEGFRLLPRLVQPLLAGPAGRPGSARRPVSAGPRSPAGARCMRSPGRPAIRRRPCAICSTVTGCSPNVSGRKLRISACASSR